MERVSVAVQRSLDASLPWWRSARAERLSPAGAGLAVSAWGRHGTLDALPGVSKRLTFLRAHRPVLNSAGVYLDNAAPWPAVHATWPLPQHSSTLAALQTLMVPPGGRPDTAAPSSPSLDAVPPTIVLQRQRIAAWAAGQPPYLASRLPYAGSEVAMWLEGVDASNLHCRLWPRAAAALEVLWSQSLAYGRFAAAAQRAAKSVVRNERRALTTEHAATYFSWADDEGGNGNETATPVAAAAAERIDLPLLAHRAVPDLPGGEWHIPAAQARLGSVYGRDLWEEAQSVAAAALLQVAESAPPLTEHELFAQRERSGRARYGMAAATPGLEPVDDWLADSPALLEVASGVGRGAAGSVHVVAPPADVGARRLQALPAWTLPLPPPPALPPFGDQLNPDVNVKTFASEATATAPRLFSLLRHLWAAHALPAAPLHPYAPSVTQPRWWRLTSTSTGSEGVAAWLPAYAVLAGLDAVEVTATARAQWQPALLLPLIYDDKREMVPLDGRCPGIKQETQRIDGGTLVRSPFRDPVLGAATRALQLIDLYGPLHQWQSLAVLQQSEARVAEVRAIRLRALTAACPSHPVNEKLEAISAAKSDAAASTKSLPDVLYSRWDETAVTLGERQGLLRFVVPQLPLPGPLQPPNLPPANRRLRFVVWNIDDGGRGGRAGRYGDVLAWLRSTPHSPDVVALVEANEWHAKPRRASRYVDDVADVNGDLDGDGLPDFGGDGGGEWATARHGDAVAMAANASAGRAAARVGGSDDAPAAPPPDATWWKEQTADMRRRAAEAGYPFARILQVPSGFHLVLAATKPIRVVAADTVHMERGLVAFDVDGVRYVVVHLHAHDPDARTLEAAWVHSWLARFASAGVPVILAGDFNTLSGLDATAGVHDHRGAVHDLLATGGSEVAYLRHKFLSQWGAQQEAELTAALESGDGAAGGGAVNGVIAGARVDYCPMTALMGRSFRGGSALLGCPEEAEREPTDASTGLLVDVVAATRPMGTWQAAASEQGWEDAKPRGTIPTAFRTDPFRSGWQLPRLRIDYVIADADTVATTPPPPPGRGDGLNTAGTPHPTVYGLSCWVMNATDTATLSDHFPIACIAVRS